MNFQVGVNFLNMNMMVTSTTFDKCETFQQHRKKYAVNILVTTPRYFSITLGSKKISKDQYPPVLLNCDVLLMNLVGGDSMTVFYIGL
jgi:hypothetical protein